MPDSNSVLAHEIDRDALSSVQARVNNLSKEVMGMVDDIVNSICHDLDAYMSYIDGVLSNTQEPVTDRELDDFVMNLSSLLYFVSDKQEKLGVEEDVSHAVYREVYNKARELASGTVADKNTAADLAAQNEYIIYTVKSRAYKIIKSKVEAGYEMVTSIKKVLTRRITEYGITNSDIT